MDKQPPKLKGSLLTFIVLQLCYLFFFFSSFPESFRNAIGDHNNGFELTASWLSMITMLSYCLISLAAVTQLVLRKHSFLRLFQISGAIALIGNFTVFVLRQISDIRYSEYKYSFSSDYYWVLFIMALFWTVIWCMYFARSSRIYSYMGDDSTYLRTAFFTKRVKEPTPWVEMKPMYHPPVYNPQNPPAQGFNPNSFSPSSVPEGQQVPNAYTPGQQTQPAPGFNQPPVYPPPAQAPSAPPLGQNIYQPPVNPNQEQS